MPQIASRADAQSSPGGVFLAFLVFSLFMLTQTVGYRLHMAPVLWYRDHPEAAGRTLQSCTHRQAGDGDCLAAWESQNPIPRPVIFSWLHRP